MAKETKHESIKPCLLRSLGCLFSMSQRVHAPSNGAEHPEVVDGSAAYSLPRVIHRSEETGGKLFPAASVNNSAAKNLLPCILISFSIRKTRVARRRIRRLDMRCLDTVLRAGRCAGPQRILSGGPLLRAGLTISPSTGLASVFFETYE